MAFLRTIVICLISAVLTVVMNLLGLGFTDPVEFSYEVRAKYSTDTRVYSLGDGRTEFNERFSSPYLISSSDDYEKVVIPLKNTNRLEQIKFEIDDSHDTEICFKNFTVSGRSGTHELITERFTYNGLTPLDAGTEDLCFNVKKNDFDAVHEKPYLLSGNFIEYTSVDTFNKWQLFFFAGLVCLCSLVWQIVLASFEHNYRRVRIPDYVSFIIFLAIVEFVCLFAFNEIMRAYVFHNSNLMLIISGVMVARFVCFFFRTIVNHKYACYSLLLLVLMMLVRYCVFRNNVGIVYRSEFMGYLHIVKQDFPFDVAIVLLFATAIFVQHKFLKITLSSVAVVSGFLMFLDYIMNTEKSDRLIFSRIGIDTFSYQNLRDVPNAINHYISTGQGVLTCAVATTVICMLVFIFTNNRLKFGWLKFFSFIVFMALSVGVYFVNIGTDSVFNNKFYNMVDVNRGIENLDFSRLSASSTNEIVTQRKGLGHKNNVVVLVVESLSSFSSKLYEEKLDLTPNLDRIASNNIWFKNSYSSGYDSDVANYAFLTMRPFLHNGSNVADPRLYRSTIARDFKKAGYKTIVMYSSKPTEAERTQFDKAGFEHLFDYMHPNYPDTAPRYDHGALDDKVLLQEAAKNIRFWSNNKYSRDKFFVEILTSSGAAPYVVPVEKRLDPTKVEYDFATVTKFTDEAIGEFVAELEKMNYFKDGILVIVGNHRAPVTLSKREYDLYGQLGITRVPLIFIDKHQRPRKYENDVSTISIGEMIEYLELDSYQSSSMRVNPFVADENEVIIYQQLSPRNTILLKNGDTYGEFYISGNKSRISGNLRDKDVIFTNLVAMLSKGRTDARTSAAESDASAESDAERSRNDSFFSFDKPLHDDTLKAGSDEEPVADAEDEAGAAAAAQSPDVDFTSGNYADDENVPDIEKTMRQQEREELAEKLKEEQQRLERVKAEAEEAKAKADEAKRRAAEAKKKADEARKKAEEAKAQAEQMKLSSLR